MIYEYWKTLSKGRRNPECVHAGYLAAASEHEAVSKAISKVAEDYPYSGQATFDRVKLVEEDKIVEILNLHGY